jgi:hypothetical protein
MALADEKQVAPATHRHPVQKPEGYVDVSTAKIYTNLLKVTTGDTVAR